MRTTNGLAPLADNDRLRPFSSPSNTRIHTNRTYQISFVISSLTLHVSYTTRLGPKTPPASVITRYVHSLTMFRWDRSTLGLKTRLNSEFVECACRKPSAHPRKIHNGSMSGTVILALPVRGDWSLSDDIACARFTLCHSNSTHQLSSVLLTTNTTRPLFAGVAPKKNDSFRLLRFIDLIINK